MDFEREKRLLFLVILLLVIAALAVTVSILSIGKANDTTPPLTPDYAPKDPDKNAEPIGDDDDAKLDQPEGGGAVSLTYAKEVT
ncbi:MAG TPA: hypothetical protein DDY70_00920, partial [Clostridiales bacterium]|nr:hypothetical protein [Clostridiales bacterium]